MMGPEDPPYAVWYLCCADDVVHPRSMAKEEAEMATASGYVTVYEASDGGSGDPRKTFWQFFVDKQAVTSENPDIADTMRFAIETSRAVDVTFDDATNVISQARIAFEYVCAAEEYTPCKPDDPPGSKQPIQICETRRRAPCIGPGSDPQP